LRFILRDWDRIWYLAFSYEVKTLPGAAPADARIARPTLSRLIQDGENRSVIRSLLASRYPMGARAIPTQERPLLSALERAMALGDCVLLRGAGFDLRHGAGKGGKGGTGGKAAAGGGEELEAWDFVPAEGEAGSVVSASESGDKSGPESADEFVFLRFSGGSEEPAQLRFTQGSEKHSGMAFAHASEGGPEFGFTDAAEGPHGLGHSAAVKSPA
jgi:hypothetical protein